MTDRRVIAITGTRSGIGRHLAGHYCDRGFLVEGCSRGPSSFTHPNYRHAQLDVADEMSVRDFFASVRKTHGRLDALVNNAAQIAVNNVLVTPLSQMQDIFRTNFMGVFLCCREAVKVMMRNRGGRIVNFTSIAVPLAPVGTAAYGSSKAAVEQFTRVLAAETAATGISAYSLSLSMVQDSGMAAAMSADAARDAVERSTLKRWLTLDEVAGAVDALLDGNGGVASGETISLGGAA
ncbi:MAG: SDR family oxidoreductase [Rhodopirellula sp.]|nr:SDR family oxidoreductase [Rhodopirellula sp.]